MLRASDCRCACHQPGSEMRHCVPCCYPDDVVDRALGEDTPRHNVRYAKPCPKCGSEATAGAPAHVVTFCMDCMWQEPHEHWNQRAPFAWTPASVPPPEEGFRYIVTFRDDQNGEAHRYHTMLGSWYADSGWMVEAQVSGVVTAWAARPEPYKGK